MMLFRYVMARFEERSTWTAIGAAIPSAAMLAYPWSIAAVVIAVIVVLVPTGG